MNISISFLLLQGLSYSFGFGIVSHKTSTSFLIEHSSFSKMENLFSGSSNIIINFRKIKFHNFISKPINLALQSNFDGYVLTNSTDFSMISSATFRNCAFFNCYNRGNEEGGAIYYKNPVGAVIFSLCCFQNCFSEKDSGTFTVFSNKIFCSIIQVINSFSNNNYQIGKIFCTNQNSEFSFCHIVNCGKANAGKKFGLGFFQIQIIRTDSNNFSKNTLAEKSVLVSYELSDIVIYKFNNIDNNTNCGCLFIYGHSNKRTALKFNNFCYNKRNGNFLLELETKMKFEFIKGCFYEEGGTLNNNFLKTNALVTFQESIFSIDDALFFSLNKISNFYCRLGQTPPSDEEYSRRYCGFGYALNSTPNNAMSDYFRNENAPKKNEQKSEKLFSTFSKDIFTVNSLRIQCAIIWLITMIAFPLYFLSQKFCPESEEYDVDGVPVAITKFETIED